MNPLLLKLSKNFEGYDNLKTESSKDDSNAKKIQENSNSNPSNKINGANSDDKIAELNSELPENLYVKKLSNEKNPSEFRASFPINQKEDKKKRCSKAFIRFKKRNSAIIIDEEKKVKASDKIKNIAAMLEKRMILKYIEGKKEDEKKENLEKKNTEIDNEILIMNKTLGKIQKKKGKRPGLFGIE